MKRLVHAALACVLTLTIAGVAIAQSTPEPVVRMGDWVEIADDAWMNIIASNTIYYRTTSQSDFDKDIQDIAGSTSATSGSCIESECDIMQWETRFGADFRYKKNLKMRVLYEQQNVMDGAFIDGTSGSSVHIERAWIDYTFPNIGLRMRVGAHLWTFDPMRWVFDDDPGFHLWYNPTKNFELYAAAIIEDEGQKIGLTNDNDSLYYLFRAAYSFQPHRVSLNIHYSRDRFCPDCDTAGNRQQTDAVYITPAWEGSFGLFKFVAQASFVFGEVEQGAAGADDLDISAFAAQIAAEVNLGSFRPFFTFLYGSGDDDPTDKDLEGYAALATKEISAVSGVSILNHLRASSQWSGTEQGPRYARAFGLNGSLRGGDNAFNNNQGINQSYDITGGYANPGTIKTAFGVRYFPVKGWEVSGAWAGMWVVETDGLEAQLNGVAINQTLNRTADIDKFMYHEFSAMVAWAINKHFDVMVRGLVALPGSGAEDIAEMTDPAICGKGPTETCDGDDPMLVGQVRFRGRF